MENKGDGAPENTYRTKLKEEDSENTCNECDKGVVCRM